MTLPIVRRCRTVAVLAAALAAAPTEAFAYIDPGTGGMLVQLLLGGVAGALVIVKLYWHRIRKAAEWLFRGRRDRRESGTD